MIYKCFLIEVFFHWMMSKRILISSPGPFKKYLLHWKSNMLYNNI